MGVVAKPWKEVTGRATPTGRYFTTGEVARLLGLAPRTASKLIDGGKLKGKRIPSGLDRRVHIDDLKAFMLEHGYDRELAVLGPGVLVCLTVCLAEADLLRERLPGWTVKEAPDAVAAGMACAGCRPDAVVFGVGAGRETVRAVVQYLNGPKVNQPVFLAVRPDDREVGWLGLEGVHELTAGDATASELAALIRRGVCP